MKKFLQLYLWLVFVPFSLFSADQRPRLAVLTDIGGDPDDRQSLIRLMIYANEFRIEALIASAAGTPGELNKAITRPEVIREIITAYGKVRSNLMRHADHWPTEDELLAVVKNGNPNRKLAYIGKGHDTEASHYLIERIDAGSPQDPLNISIWGGQTDLAQALWRIKNDHGDSGLREFVTKFRVYDIADQDGIAQWMRQEFPGMFYILSLAPKEIPPIQSTFRGMFLTGDESLTSRDWIHKNVLRSGALGAMYPTQTHTWTNPHGCVKEGDTPAWFFFLPIGGNDPSDPAKPGWGGQYQRNADGWFTDLPTTKEQDPRHTISRWRSAYQEDFAKRMNWCREP